MMKKFNKKALIVFLIIFVLVFICLIASTAIKDEQEIAYRIEDTLLDGGGRKAKIIILAGQSNAAGCSLDEYLRKNVSSEKYLEYSEGYDNVYINYNCSYRNMSFGFVPCKTNQGETEGYFGPELGLAEKLHNEYPDELFFILKCAWSGTDLFNQWLSPSSKGKTGVLYKSFIKFLEQNINYLKLKNYDIMIEGLCWMQGESDSFHKEFTIQYEEHLNNFIMDIRNRFGKYSSSDGIALIDALIADNPVYWVFCEQVNQSKWNVANSSSINVVIDTNAEGLACKEEPTDKPDLAHYDSLSEIKLGHLFFEYLKPFLDK